MPWRVVVARAIDPRFHVGHGAKSDRPPRTPQWLGSPLAMTRPWAIHVRAVEPYLDAAVRPVNHVRHFDHFDPRHCRGQRATLAPRPSTHWDTRCCRPSLPRVGGIGLFGTTLSLNEMARSSQAVGYLNGLPRSCGHRRSRRLGLSSRRWGASDRRLPARSRALRAAMLRLRRRPLGTTAGAPQPR